MINRYFLSLFLGCTYLSGIAQIVQTPNPGISAYQSYGVQDDYNVDLSMGQLNSQIQIASYSQLGRLHPINYYIGINNPAFSQYVTCDSYSGNCLMYYDLTPATSITSGANLLTNYSAVKVTQDSWAQNDYQNGGFYTEIRYSITDPTGNIHSLLADSTQDNILHAADGSGYSLIYPPGSNIFNLEGPPSLVDPTSGKIYDSSGIIYTSSSATDPNGNLITLSATGITDSIGRALPAVPDPNSSYTWSRDVSHCPDLGDPNQTADDSVSLNLPGVGGASQEILLCYTGVTFHLNANNSFSPAYDDSYPAFTFDPNTTNSFMFVNTVGSFAALQSLVFPDGSYYGFLYDASTVVYDSNYVPQSASEAYGTLSKIIYPTGASASFTSSPLVGVGTYEQPGGYPATYYRPVASVTRNDANGNIGTTTYQRGPTDEGTYNQRGTVAGQPNQYTVDETDAAQNVTRHTFTDLSGTQNFTQNYETQTDSYQGAVGGQPLKTVYTTYQYQPAITVADPVYSEPYAIAMVLPYSKQTVLNGQVQTLETFSYTPQSSLKRITCYTASCGPVLTSNNSNVAVLTSYGATPSSQTVTDASGNQLSSLVNSPFFASNPAYKNANILDIPGQTQTLDAQNNLAAQTTYGYDESGGPQGVYGNLTSVTQWLNTGGQNPKTTTAFNNNGMPSLLTDANGNQTNIAAYQCAGLYPQSVTKAYQSQTTVPETSTYVYDCATGALLSSTDPNGVQTQYIYNDSLNRLTQVKYAVGTQGENWMTSNYPSRTQTNVTEDEVIKGDGILNRSTIYDGFGRTIHQTDDAGNTVDTTYNLVGEIASISNPHGPNNGITSYVYDALGRKTLQCQSDNGTSGPCTPGNSYLQWFYAGDVTTFTDELRNPWQRTYDALGRLSKIVEPGLLASTYQYSPLNELTCADQWGTGPIGQPCTSSRIRSFVYDSLSHLTSATNPETGTIGYGYDANGNLTLKTDARGVQTNYSYDALNRLVSKLFSGGSTVTTASACYQYDISGSGSANFIGRLTSEWTQFGPCASSPPGSGQITRSSILAYDAMGRVLGEQQCHLSKCTSGLTYHNTMGYDLAGNPTFYSNGFQSIGLTNVYDTAGRLKNINSSFFGPSYPASILSVGAYTAAGAIQSMTLGTEINATTTYDNRLRPTNQTATHP